MKSSLNFLDKLKCIYKISSYLTFIHSTSVECFVNFNADVDGDVDDGDDLCI